MEELAQNKKSKKLLLAVLLITVIAFILSVIFVQNFKTMDLRLGVSEFVYIIGLIALSSRLAKLPQLSKMSFTVRFALAFLAFGVGLSVFLNVAFYLRPDCDFGFGTPHAGCYYLFVPGLIAGIPNIPMLFVLPDNFFGYPETPEAAIVQGIIFVILSAISYFALGLILSFVIQLIKRSKYKIKIVKKDESS